MNNLIEYLKSKKVYPLNHNRLPDSMVEENKLIDDFIHEITTLEEKLAERDRELIAYHRNYDALCLAYETGEPDRLWDVFEQIHDNREAQAKGD